jgi:hypothetical protein
MHTQDMSGNNTNSNIVSNYRPISPIGRDEGGISRVRAFLISPPSSCTKADLSRDHTKYIPNILYHTFHASLYSFVL